MSRILRSRFAFLVGTIGVIAAIVTIAQAVRDDHSYKVGHTSAVPVCPTVTTDSARREGGQNA